MPLGPWDSEMGSAVLLALAAPSGLVALLVVCLRAVALEAVAMATERRLVLVLVRLAAIPTAATSLAR